ncbi:MAG TPA: glutathione S-transferase family protein, partial [Caulobacteraceae bacterium]|nr:glutathione S-transferase family protein [Caulobacteraceae bacterium]
MREFTVHGVPGSPYVRIALLGLEEKGAAWRLAPMHIGEMRGPSHIEKHAFGRMPILDHGDFRLYEAQAILRYLDRIIPQPSLTPSDPRAEARMNQLCGITDWYVMPDISSGVTFGRVVAPKFGIPVDEAKIQAAIPRARVCVAEISRLLGSQTYLAGEAVSLADLMMAPHLSILEGTAEGEEMLAPHANVRDWIERMEARPSMRNTTWK